MLPQWTKHEVTYSNLRLCEFCSVSSVHLGSVQVKNVQYQAYLGWIAVYAACCPEDTLSAGNARIAEMHRWLPAGYVIHWPGR